jgi:hypothetical protein
MTIVTASLEGIFQALRWQKLKPLAGAAAGFGLVERMPATRR